MIKRKEFYQEVYSIVRQIPYGRVCTYGIIARLAGYPDHARFVGRALADAPKALALPCHRVVNAQGAIVPAWPQQRMLLEQEGVRFKKNGRINLPEFLSLSPD